MVNGSTSLLLGSISLSQSGCLRISDFVSFWSDLGTVLGGIFDLDISKSTDFVRHLLKQENIA
jgi:hypothetical protein